VAPGLSQALFDACRAGDWSSADACRTPFMPLEDIRDAWGPARVLHAAVTAAAIADAGPIPPFVSELSTEQQASVRDAVVQLAAAWPYVGPSLRT